MNVFSLEYFIYIYILSAIWLSRDQLWAIIERTASITRCLALHLSTFGPKYHWKPDNKVASLSLAEHRVGFERNLLICSKHINSIGHGVTSDPPRFSKYYEGVRWGWNFFQWMGDGKFWFFYWVVGIWGGMTFSKLIATFWEEHWLKSKLAWPVLK